MDNELDATKAYTYQDYDGESLTFRKRDKGAGDSFLSCEYRGEGPVHFSGSDAVVRTALAMLARGADKETPGVREAMTALVEAVQAVENNRRYKIGEKVEVWDDYTGHWIGGAVTAYMDDNGDYSVLRVDSGVSIAYDPLDIRRSWNPL